MKKQTAGRDKLGEIAPKFAELNDDVLFGEVWSRTDQLSLRDRSIITVTALMTKGIFDSSLKYHITNAKNNGVSKSMMVEIVTHLAFYVGWPNAWAVLPIVMEVYKDEVTGFTPTFGLGSFNSQFDKYFIGKSYLNQVAFGSLPVFNVTFEPGCRNNWHIHKASNNGGQLLICTDGEGWYQEFGKDPIKLHPGDVITIGANVKHWHGATKDSWFAHLALSIPGENASTEWCEEVTDLEYNKL